MARTHVDHGDIARFAQDRVNLPREKAKEYRAQARRLRERLESYLTEHPDFTLRKMLLLGSLAKGTALRSLNDIDVACYISGADAPGDVASLLDYLAERLRKAFPNFSPDQMQAKTYSAYSGKSDAFPGTRLKSCRSGGKGWARRLPLSGADTWKLRGSGGIRGSTALKCRT